MGIYGLTYSLMTPEGSQWKGLAWHHGLNWVAFLRNWEVRMKRGGKVRDVEDLVQEPVKAGARRIVISAGGNDMAGLSDLPLE